MSDAVEILRAERSDAPIFITCEHASELLPEPWQWPGADERLIGTHWTYDLGAADLAKDLAARFGAGAILARFSRLLVDPNRELESDTLFRTEAEGAPVELNAGLDDAEREERIERLWRRYHAAADREVAAVQASIVLSVHTFTPLYEGARREVEVGVLFNRETALAESVAKAIQGARFRAELNEPYSGKVGLIYSAERHASAHGRRALELEVRQDLAVRRDVRERIVEALVDILP